MFRFYSLIFIFISVSGFSSDLSLNGFIGLRDFSGQANYGNQYHFTPHTGALIALENLGNFSFEISAGFTQGLFSGIRVRDYDAHFALSFSMKRFESFIPFVRTGISDFYTDITDSLGGKTFENYIYYLIGGGIRLNTGSILIFRIDFNVSTNFLKDSIIHTSLGIGFYIL